MAFIKMHVIAKLTAIALCLFLIAPGAQATGSTSNKINVSTQAVSNATDPRDAVNSDSWKIVVAPYLWALNMNGTTQIGGLRLHVNQSFSDILSQLNWAGMVWVDASKDKFGIFLNALYASLSNGASDRYISAHVNNNFGLFSAGVSYQIYKTCLCKGGCLDDSPTLAISPYAGLRYTTNDVSLTINTPLGNIHLSDNQGWTDPIIGARFNVDLSKAWLVLLAGDIGGTNACSDYSYNVQGFLGYKPQTIMKRTTWYLGYRLLDQHYITGSSSNYFNWNMKLYGPIVGVSFTF